MNRTFKFVVFVTVFLLVPAYVFARILLPDLLIGRVVSVLPKESNLIIGQSKTMMDLSVVFNDIAFSGSGVSMEIDRMQIRPRLSLENPLVLTLSKLKLVQKNHTTLLNDLSIKLFPNESFFKEPSLSGHVESLNNAEFNAIPQETVMLKDVDFFIDNIKNAASHVDVQASNLTSSINMPLGSVRLYLKDFEMTIKETEGLDIIISSQTSKLDVSELVGVQASERFLISDVLEISFGLKKDHRVEIATEKVWNMPFSYVTQNLHTKDFKVADRLTIEGSGYWNSRSSNCELHGILQAEERCGKLIHVIDINVDIEDSDAHFKLVGEGYCVAPKSGCRQEIKAKIFSRNTGLIFSNLMATNLINPLVGGIVLGGLMSSPVQHDHFDHQADFQMLGSQILLNGASLIK